MPAAFDRLDPPALQAILQFCYFPYVAESDDICLVCKRFCAAYRALPAECVRTVVREYLRKAEPPADLPDSSEETTREFHSRVALMCLATLAARLRLQSAAFAPDAAALYPGLDPNPDILIDFSAPTAADQWRMAELAARATVLFQSSPFDYDWLPCDAFSDQQQYSVQYKWAKVEVALPQGGLTLTFQDSFEHSDPNFGPWGLAMRVLHATPHTEAVAAALDLPEGTATVVSQAFKEHRDYDLFRYYLDTKFFIKLTGLMGWEAPTLAQSCTLVSLLLTQTHRRAFSTLLLGSHAVLRMELPCPEPLGRLGENLKLVYPTKDAETAAALRLVQQTEEKFKSAALLPSTQAAAVEYFRGCHQAAYDRALTARTLPPSPWPYPLYTPPQGMTTFNTAVNQMHLNAFHRGPNPLAPPGPPPFYPYPMFGPPMRPPARRPPRPAPRAAEYTGSFRRTYKHEAPRPVRGNVSAGKDGKGRQWSGRLPSGRGRTWKEKPGEGAKAAEDAEPPQVAPEPTTELGSPTQWPALGAPGKAPSAPSAPPDPPETEAAATPEPATDAAVPKAPPPAKSYSSHAYKNTHYTWGSSNPHYAQDGAKTGKRRWRPLTEVVGQ